MIFFNIATDGLTHNIRGYKSALQTNCGALIIVIFREPLRGVGAPQPAAARRVRGTRRGRGR